MYQRFERVTFVCIVEPLGEACETDTDEALGERRPDATGQVNDPDGGVVFQDNTF